MPFRLAIRELRRGWATCLLAVVTFILLSLSAAGAQQVKIAPPDPNLAEAETLFRQGQMEQAKEKVQQALAQNSSSMEGYNLLGIICAAEKDYASAVDALQHALNLEPHSVKTRNNLANVYVAESKPDLAEKEFRTILAASPGDRDANYNFGLLLLAKGSPSAAIARFERVKPSDTETRLSLIRAFLQAGKTAEGLSAATALSAENKSDIRLHFTLGVLLASEKQYRAAQLELEKANALQPESPEILNHLAEAYFRNGDNAKAELVLNRALALTPDAPDTLYSLAQVYANQARPVDALSLLVRAHKLAPQNTDIIFLMARVSMTQNYFEDAIPLLESGLKIDPRRADLQAALGESYFMAGKTERAVEEFKKLIELDPSARSYAFMGLSYRHLGMFDEARKYFEEGLKRDPHNTSCLFNLGYIDERQGNDARAKEMFQAALRSNPNYPEALLELANLRAQDKAYTEAAELLRKYVKLSRDPASGYYKLAMVERNLHQNQAAQRDLNVFQTLSKTADPGPYPYQHLFDYLDDRSKLTASQRDQLEINELTEQIAKNPGRPQDLYMLAESYLKLGKLDEARGAIAQLDQISSTDYRTQAGVGVMLARYHLYDDAIRHFQTALQANPDSDDVKFDLADAYFRKGMFDQALAAAQGVAPPSQQDHAYLALLGDIYAHLGDSTKAAEIFREAIGRSPDNDQYYLSLALVELRENDLQGAEQTLQKGMLRIPGSGKLLWGMGLVSILQGKTAQAAERLERAVELLPEWAGSYSTLGVFYYQTGQIEKAREVLERFKGSHAAGLDVDRIEQALDRAPATSASATGPMPMAARRQVLQMALSIADRTL